MIPAPIRAIVDARDENACVCCGQPATDRHHRIPGGMGGRKAEDHHSPQNIVTLHGSGNIDGCHGRAHQDREWALANGYRVPRGVDPRTVPITHHAWGRVWLTSDGGFNLDPQEVPT